MAIIFNSKDLNITEQQMKILYRKNLIKCNDYTLTVATIPNWAIGEAESIVNKKFAGTEIDDTFVPGNKIDMSLKNKYDYPKLYKSICEQWT